MRAVCYLALYIDDNANSCGRTYTHGLKTIPSTNSRPDLISIVKDEINTTEEIRWKHLNKKNCFFLSCIKWNEERFCAAFHKEEKIKFHAGY